MEDIKTFLCISLYTFTDTRTYHSHFMDEETKAQTLHYWGKNGEGTVPPAEESKSPGGNDFPMYAPHAPPGARDP